MLTAMDTRSIVALVLRAADELEANASAETIERDWRDWHAALFAVALRPPYADYHATFWDWVWAIRSGVAPSRPFVAIWPRGFAKSTSVEIAVAAVAALGTRSYGLYVCDTQDQADKHVANVAGLLESASFGKSYPRVAARKIGKYGNSQGWRRNRLRTSSGFTLDAIGFDAAVRGAKVDEDRPDFFVFDDVDDVLDSPATVQKKITILTTSLLPARAPHAAIVFAQNLIHSDGIVAQLADGRADFLANREVSGPHPALRNAVYEQGEDGKWRIVDGEPTWPAMGIPELQSDLDEMGVTAFRREKQHEVDQIEGGIFGHLTFRHCAWADLPPLDRIVVWVDPAVTDTDKSDAHGIQADGIARDGTVYRLWSWENRTSPEDAMRRAILKAVELNAECVGVETDQGGDTWRSAYDAAWTALVADSDVPQITAGQPAQDGQPAIKPTRKPTFKQDKAGAGHGPKAHRASLMLADYERGRIVHVIGTHEALERALRRYLIRKPYDLVDSSYYSWHDLRKGSVPIATPGGTRQTSTWSHAS